MSQKDALIKLANELTELAASYEEAVTPPVPESKLLDRFLDRCMNAGWIYRVSSYPKARSLEDIFNTLESQKLAYNELTADYQYLHEVKTAYMVALQNAGIPLPVIEMAPPALEFPDSEDSEDEEDEDQGEEASW
jgi:hypothetical protein